MTIQQIAVEPFEQGTAIVTIAPVDDNNTALTFAQLINPQWQLMRASGTIIGEGAAKRSFALSAMTSLQFVLSESDLAIFGEGDRGNRVISFHADYTGTLDDGTPFDGHVVAEGTFVVQKVLGQVDET